ncbi:MAG: FAD-dependent oxidoreductase [Planctomycetota bacterium]|nr:MAG: FAD-dependent oxidoreductase [Planctomycetota bacterium]REK20503.1 MAG: FAD-dependent oxidoreductase [Planctomycetota bacterium]REK28257.1 MAG: FAD-dependent oxidoreductase [Planctomycetota bacterium]
MPRLFVLLSLLFGTTSFAEEYDLVIYGGTSGGVAAAVQADRMGKSVVLIEPREHVGGLSVSGLGWTDTGNKAVIGGVSREFYQRVKSYYDRAEAWIFERPGDYATYKPDQDAIWAFEPHAAEWAFGRMLRETDVVLLLGKSLARPDGVGVKEGRITHVVMTDGSVYSGEMFIDATYEGDLMAAAGVTYTVGREANGQYDETLNGVQVANAIHHQFTHPVDPFIRPGEAASGLLSGIGDGPGRDGEADHRVQAYNFRLALTDVPKNRIPFEKPEGYDPLDHELLLRNFEAGDRRIPLSILMVPNRKTDLNNNFAVSTDWIGMNYDYPEGSYDERAAFEEKLETYVRGFLWTLQNHPRVPQEIRDQVAKWGYSRDEWVDNNHWPYWCYIREARRMVSDYVQTEHDCLRTRMCDDPVGMGSYNMDSHNCQRYVDEHGHVRNEGDVQVSPGGPYLISYGAIVPKRDECENLLVPVCLSSSHIAYGSIRMEPVFMILGQSAATAACLALDAGVAVQDVEYAALRERLLADGQVLDIPPGSIAPSGINPKSLDGIVVDDTQAEKEGAWSSSRSVGGFVGRSYLHDLNEGQGEKSVTFKLPVEKPGRYEVRLSYTPNPNRATNAPVTITHADGETIVTVNQRDKPEIEDAFVSLGEFEFAADEAASVTVSNANADGYVVADAVWVVRP